MDIELEMKKIGQNAKDASMILACASADQKQKALENDQKELEAAKAEDQPKPVNKSCSCC